MGQYLEKNIQAFIDIQAKMQEQSKVFYDGKGFGPEMWTQFINGQAPMIQTMMGSYIEQSKNLFLQMQEKMQTQTRSMFGGTFPPAGFPPAGFPTTGFPFVQPTGAAPADPVTPPEKSKK